MNSNHGRYVANKNENKYKCNKYHSPLIIV